MSTKNTLKAGTAGTIPAALVNIAPADAMVTFVACAKATRDAAIMLVYAGVAYLLNVNHLREVADPLYLSKSAAVDEMTKQLVMAANVKGGMLDIYVSRAETLYSKARIMGKFKPIIDAISHLAPDKANEAPSLIQTWMTDNFGAKNIADVSRLLGYSTGKKRTAPEARTPDQQVASVITSITTMAEAIGEGDLPKATETKLIHDVANAVPNPLALATEALNRYVQTDMADETELLDFIKLAEKLVTVLETRHASKDGDKAKATPAKAKTKANTKHATA